MATADAPFPRTIWFLWFQGLENAPEVVRRCHRSWLELNPGWELRTLDEGTLSSVISRDYARGAIAGQLPNHRANLVRLELLDRYGGVWADATCLCRRPLDDWLTELLGSGFFAFRRPRRNRVIATWFLASRPGNVLVERWLERMAPYWSTHTFRDAPRLRELLTRHLGRSPARRAWWFSPLVRDVLRVAPYFAFHYGFEQLVREDADAARVWEATPVRSADPPHVPFRAGLLEPLTPRVRAEIDGRETPVYKLTWKLPQRPVPPDSILAYLFASAPR